MGFHQKRRQTNHDGRDESVTQFTGKQRRGPGGSYDPISGLKDSRGLPSVSGVKSPVRIKSLFGRKVLPSKRRSRIAGGLVGGPVPGQRGEIARLLRVVSLGPKLNHVRCPSFVNIPGRR